MGKGIECVNNGGRIAVIFCQRDHAVVVIAGLETVMPTISVVARFQPPA
jgi:hypothetical protein